MSTVLTLTEICNRMPTDDFDFWDLFLDSLNAEVLGAHFARSPQFHKRAWIPKLQDMADFLDEAGVAHPKEKIASAILTWLDSGRPAKAKSVPAVLSVVLPKMVRVPQPA